jgi:hypothetical protein
LVSARRRGWLGIQRRERRFFPSADIRRVYREGSAVRVDLHEDASGKRSFQFWPGDLRAAATIVALLPTANTVEVDVPAPSETTPAPARRTGTALWVLALSAAAVAALIAASVAFLRQGERTLQSASSATAIPPLASSIPTAPNDRVEATETVAPAPDPEVFNGLREYDRIEPQMSGLKTQFMTALTALELGTLTREDFSNGLENWLIPQWRVVGNEIAEATPLRGSIRFSLHDDLYAVATIWQAALESYATGLREQDTDRNLAAFAQMGHASDLEQHARDLYKALKTQVAANSGSTGTHEAASP